MHYRRLWREPKRLNVRVALAAAVFLSVWALLASAEARATTDYLNLTSDDAYASSVAISQAGFGPGVDGVVVANGDDYRAATCSAVLAAAYEGPVLLTPSGSLDPRVRNEIWRLGPNRIFVVGTEAAVANDIASAFPELARSGRILMLNGVDSGDTARLVARQVKARVGSIGGLILLADDPMATPAGCAVVASALGAAKSWPMLFVPASGPLSSSTAKAMMDLAPAVVVQVQTSVEASVGAEVIKLLGANPYELAARIDEYAVSVGLSYAHTGVAAGSDGLSAQGLSLGASLARNKGIAVLCAESWVPPETIGVLSGAAGAAKRVDLCGPSEWASQRVQLLLRSSGLPSAFGAMTLKERSKGNEVAWLEQKLTELSYRPGPVDGHFDRRTRQAVIAFQKWEGLNRDGLVKGEVWWSLLGASQPVPLKSGQGAWIEVDKKRQVLLYCVDGTVERTLAVSTGSGGVGIVTPSGTFHIVRENTYERLRYKPLYLRRSSVLAIHGYPIVPVHPASHGCVRMTWADMDEFHALIPVGTAVYIY